MVAQRFPNGLRAPNAEMIAFAVEIRLTQYLIFPAIDSPSVPGYAFTNGSCSPYGREHSGYSCL